MRLPHPFRHLAHEGDRHTGAYGFSGPTMFCPGPNSRTQRITRLDITVGAAVCCACGFAYPLDAEPSGGPGPVLRPHLIPERVP